MIYVLLPSIPLHLSYEVVHTSMIIQHLTLNKRPSLQLYELLSPCFAFTFCILEPLEPSEWWSQLGCLLCMAP